MMMTPTQAAKFLGVSKHTLMDWKRKEQIPYFQQGSTIRFNSDDLLEWIQAKTRNKKKARKTEP